MLSKETIKRGLLRALDAFIIGALGGFAIIPIDLTDPKRFILALALGMVIGGLSGVQKMIRGYLKYDRKE